MSDTQGERPVDDNSAEPQATPAAAQTPQQPAPAAPTPPYGATPRPAYPGAPTHQGASMHNPYGAHGAYATQQPHATGTFPTPPPLPGAAFGPAVHGENPTLPLGDHSERRETEKKQGGAGRLVALLVAAALVGGAAGLGGAYAGSQIWQVQAEAPAGNGGAVTINNPESVTATTAIATKVLPSVVTIDVSGGGSGGSGSGVILSDDGYVVTNTHVVTLDGASSDPAIRVTTSDGRIYDATVVGLDPIYDLAVIKLEGASGLTPIEFADSSELNVGDQTVAIGAPLGLSNTVTTGIVSALNRSIQIASSAVPDSSEGDQGDQGDSGQEGGPFQFDIPGQQNQQRSSGESISIAVIQTDAAINPGNSGGALVDGEGKLIGINVAIATAGSSSGASGSIGVGFSIPSDVVQRVTDEIIADGAATHGLLGASVQSASSVQGATIAGAYIAAVTDGGAAAAAGLREGDVVTEFNGIPISDSVDLTAQVRAVAAGSDATVTYVRDGQTRSVEVTLGTLQ